MGRKTAHIDVQIEKNSAAIRDLISVSRTVIDAQQNTEKHMIRMYSEIKTELELLIKAVNAFPNRIRYSLTYGSSIRQAECHLTAGNQTRDINDLQYESGEICPVCPDCVRNYRTCG